MAYCTQVSLTVIAIQKKYNAEMSNARVKHASKSKNTHSPIPLIAVNVCDVPTDYLIKYRQQSIKMAASPIWVFRLPQKATAPASFSQGRLALGATNQEAKNALK
jgi:hypothetical protein